MYTWANTWKVPCDNGTEVTGRTTLWAYAGSSRVVGDATVTAPNGRRAFFPIDYTTDANPGQLFVIGPYSNAYDLGTWYVTGMDVLMSQLAGTASYQIHGTSRMWENGWVAVSQVRTINVCDAVGGRQIGSESPDDDG